MNINENKRVLAVAAIFAAAFLVLMYLGFSWRSECAKENDWLLEQQSAFDEMRERTYPPGQKSLKTLKEADAKTERIVENEMKACLEGYRGRFVPADGKLVSPQSFQAEVRLAVLNFEELAKKHSVTVSPNGAAKLGMAAYQNTYPSDAAAPILSFELKAVEKVVRNIVENGGRAINKIHCAEIPEEAIAAPGRSLKQNWASLPFEINFTAGRSTLFNVLNALAGDKEFCYLITALRVDTPDSLPVLSAYKPPVQTVGEDLGSEFSDSDQKKAAKGAPVREIARQMLGPGTSKDVVRVHLALEVLYLQPAKNK